MPNAVNSLSASMRVGVAPRKLYPFYGSYTNPKPHCNLAQVKSQLRGMNLDKLRDDDGELNGLYDDILNLHIPEVTQTVVKHIRQNLDLCKDIWFFTGPGSNALALPRRYIQYINLVFLRVIQSVVWYRFQHIRKTDGSEFAAIGGIEPAPPLPERIPPDMTLPVNFSDVLYTGLEDADLLFDPRRRTLRIPPRVLVANLSTPIWSYTFFAGVWNVEVHFVYGFPPTKYLDGQPLFFDPNGVLGETSPINLPNFPGGAGVDWSSGMDTGFTGKVAQLVANKIRRLAWGANSQGLSSISVDGTSESYGSAPFGGDPDKQDEATMERLTQFGLLMI